MNTAGSSRGRVQSVDRALQILESLADAGGSASLGELSATTGLPGPTIHRLIGTLRDRGYVRQEPSRRYALGATAVRLGETAGRLLGSWVEPTLSSLVDATGETANMAMLDGDQVVYLAQVPSRHSMRMFTEVGRRVDVHCTAVGKALVAGLTDEEIAGIVARRGMTRHTQTTITDPASFLRHIRRVRERGYACDEGEQEWGVRCLAVVAESASGRVALSVSGPEARFTPDRRDAAIPVLLAAAEDLVRREIN